MEDFPVKGSANFMPFCILFLKSRPEDKKEGLPGTFSPLQT
jgi:hypothetical protein